jgi:predicted RNA-binding protein with RPS1 domain
MGSRSLASVSRAFACALVLALALLGGRLGARGGAPGFKRAGQAPRPARGGSARGGGGRPTTTSGSLRFSYSSRDDSDALRADAAMARTNQRGGDEAPARLNDWLPTVADGDAFAGKVTRVCGYGAFVELVPESRADPYEPDVFMQRGYDRPWRPIGLLHISALTPDRVTDVEAYITNAVGPIGSRVVVSLKSTNYNDKKRISLDLVDVLQRGDMRVRPRDRVGLVVPTRALSAPARLTLRARLHPSPSPLGLALSRQPIAWRKTGSEADEAPAVAPIAGANWVADARARSPTPRIELNSARRWVAWPNRDGALGMPTGEAAVAADAEDASEGPTELADRQKAVIYRAK